MKVTKSLDSILNEILEAYSTPVDIVDGVSHRVDKLTNQITAYLGSKYTEGNEEDGDRRPFFQILTQVVDVESRAVSIKRKNIDAYSVDGDYVFSMMYEKELQEEFDILNIEDLLKDHQESKIKYGTSLLLESDCDNEIGYKLEVVDFTKAYVDPFDIDGGRKMFPHYLDFVTLENKRGVWNEDSIDSAIYYAEKAGEQRVEVFHVEGVMTEEMITGEGEDTYAVYEVYVAECGGKRFYLDHNKLENKRVHTFHRENRPGNSSGQGIGAVEEVLEEQIWINDIAISMHEAMALGSKVGAKTNKNDVPSIMNLNNGFVVDLEEGEDFQFVTPNMPNMSHLSFIDSWFQNMQRKSSAFEAVTGEEAKAGTPYSGQALQSAQASSIFNYRREKDAQDVIYIVENIINPRMITRINKEHELNAAYSPKELRIIDDYVINEMLLDYIMENEGAVLPSDLEEKRVEIQVELSKKGDRRKGLVPSGFFTKEDVEKKIRIYITSDMDDVQNKINNMTAQLSSLAEDDPMRFVYQQEIMELSGQSPAKFTNQSAGNLQSAGPTGLQKEIAQITAEGQT